MLYRVIDYQHGKYIVDYYSSTFDVYPVRLKIDRWKFKDWASGMYDKSVLDGKRVDLHKLRQSKIKKSTPPIVKISDKEKAILDYVSSRVGQNKYILERDIVVKGISKALITRTVKNEKLLRYYKLGRIRLNKNIKADLGITDKGYPIIIVGS